MPARDTLSALWHAVRSQGVLLRDAEVDFDVDATSKDLSSEHASRFGVRTLSR
jgi:hypothetical protein